MLPLLSLLVYTLFNSALFASAAMATTEASSCAVVGVGVLGTHLCRQLLDFNTYDTVVGMTRTNAHHAHIQRACPKLQLVTQDDFVGSETRFQTVVFCAPPSGFDDYAAAVQAAATNLWMGPDSGGTFVFTSSGGVYAQENGETVTEDSPTGDSPRMIRLLDAERAALAAGGCVLRLAGLYNLERGAHNYWLSASEIVGGPDGIINLLHYEDAASACMAALLAGPQQQQRLFLISDGNPMTRRQICEYALSAAVYKEKSMPMFAPAQEGKLFTIGKVYDGSKSNQLLNWKPVYPSFAAFMASNA